MSDSEVFTLAELVEKLATQDVGQRQLSGMGESSAQLFMRRDNEEVLDLTEMVEKHAQNPNRAKGAVQVHDFDSLDRLVRRMGHPDHSRIYVDVDQKQFVAVLLDNQGLDDAPQWRDHRVGFQAMLSPEMARWVSLNEKWTEQVQFAEHLEKNLRDFQGDEGTRMVMVASTLEAKRNASWKSAIRLDNGETRFGYEETIDATAVNGTVQIPASFGIGVRLFKGDSTGVRLTLRLRYRLKGSQCHFQYEIIDLDFVLEQALRDMAAKLAAAGFQVVFGRP